MAEAIVSIEFPLFMFPFMWLFTVLSGALFEIKIISPSNSFVLRSKVPLV